MKKIVLLIAAVAVVSTVNAQIVVGLQGGYHQLKNTNSLNGDFSSENNYVGGLRVGYMVTPKLYVGLFGGLNGSNTSRLQEADTALYPIAGNNEDEPFAIKDHQWATTQSGWNAAVQVRYELLKYGNMHFHLMLQGGYTRQGYTHHKESFVWAGGPHPGEYWEPTDPFNDSISVSTLNISLRPTLTYEFSRHLSAELSLDFLSIGYTSTTTSYDAKMPEPFTTKSDVLYAGLNTLMETLRWESPLLRLGFNWTF